MNKMVLKYCFICLVLFGFVLTANGEMYFWTDKNGVKHFSNTVVPPEYLQDATKSGESKSNYQPPLPENNHDATKSWGVQYREVTSKEIETFGNELLGKLVEIACKFSEVSDVWVRNLLRDDRFVGIMVDDSDNNYFQYVFANKKKYGRTLLQMKKGDRLRLIGKVQRVEDRYVFMVEEIRR